jgi:uncharacterized protein (TIGR03435 family)
MLPRIVTLIALAMTFAGATAQAQPELAFDAASVKLSPIAPASGFTTSDRGGPGSSDPARWSCEYYSLRDLLVKAFALYGFQILGPAWMDGQRFHIEAKLPHDSTREQFREMLRNLLVGRFALAARLESRSMTRYELAAARTGPRLRNAVDRPAAATETRPSSVELDADGFPKIGAPTNEPEILTVHGRTRMFFPRMTIADLAQELTSKLERPVIDVTALQGKYDINLYWSDTDGGPALTQALHDQLGLQLEQKKGPVDILVIQHLEKLPAAN